MSQLPWDFEQDGSQLPLSQDEFEVLPTDVEVVTAQAVGSAIEAAEAPWTLRPKTEWEQYLRELARQSGAGDQVRHDVFLAWADHLEVYVF